MKASILLNIIPMFGIPGVEWKITCIDLSFHKKKSKNTFLDVLGNSLTKAL